MIHDWTAIMESDLSNIIDNIDLIEIVEDIRIQAIKTWKLCSKTKKFSSHTFHDYTMEMARSILMFFNLLFFLYLSCKK